MSRSPGLSTRALLTRRSRTTTLPIILLAVIVAVIAGIATAIPRVLDTTTTLELRQQLGGLAATQRDLVSTDPVADPGLVVRDLEAIRDEAPQRLRDRLGEPASLILSDPFAADDLEPEPGDPEYEISFAFDPTIVDHVTIVDGTAPLPAASGPDGWPTDVDIMLASDAATAMNWEIGDQRRIDGFVAIDVRLAGTFEAAEPTAERWSHEAVLLESDERFDFDSPPIISAVGVMGGPEGFNAVGVDRTHSWIPLGVADITAADAAETLDLLRSFTSATHALQSDTLTTIRFGSQSVETIEDVAARVAATNAVLMLTAAGPLGVAVAVLALATALITRRRAAGLALVTARGASAGQLAVTHAVEGLFIGAPAAALGVAVAILLVPGPVGALALVTGSIVAVIPSLMLAYLGRAGAFLRVRSDLGNARATRARWLGEGAVLALAAVSVFLLISRGVTNDANPLIAATPLLLSIVICLAVLRLLPLVLRAVTGAMRRRTGLIGFLGAARAVRDPVTGLAPVLAMVVGTSVAVFSGILLTSVASGLESASRTQVGADVSITGVSFGEPQREGIAAIEGVSAVAALDAPGYELLMVDGERETVAVIVTDVAALDDVGWIDEELPASSGAPAIVVSSDLAARLPRGASVTLDGTEVEVVAEVAVTRGVVARANWVLIDREVADELFGGSFTPRDLLIGLVDDADERAVAAAALEIAGDGARLLTPAIVSERFRSSPVAAGMSNTLLSGLLVIALLCSIAIIISTVVNAASRNALLALLRVLGVPSRASRWLVLWEVGPIAVIALLAGIGLGIGMPYLVLASIDLRPFTGDTVQPPIMINPALVALTAGVYLFAVAVSLTTAVVAGRLTDPVSSLRIDQRG